MRLNYGRLVLFCLTLGSLISFSWYSARSRTGFSEDPENELMLLYKGLLVVEERSARVSSDLNRVLDAIKFLAQKPGNSSRNITDYDKDSVRSVESISHLPNAYHYLPHLKGQRDALHPNVLLGQGRTGVSMVLGIPTVKREKQSYLISTLNSLFYDLTPEERADIVVVVFVAEDDKSYVDSVADSIRRNFPIEAESGILEVVSPSPYFYPNLDQLKETFGDTKERVKWRTKQNLDYSFLMLYAQPKGSYYVQLEDDIIAKAGYLQIMKKFVAQQNSDDWLILEFSQLGFIGKMFRASDLPMVVEFILMFYKDKPIDWLLDHILWVKVCHPEKDLKNCNGEKNILRRRFRPSLFQHVGIHSSLRGKIQNLKDRDFGQQLLHKHHANPPAEVTSSLAPYQSHTIERAYRGEDFFWGMSPVAGDYIKIMFFQPQAVKGYLFHSGNIETNGDKFYNTTVEVLPVDKAVLEEVENGQLHMYKKSHDGYITIGAFVNGVAEGKLDPTVQRISAIRLVVHTDSDVWVILSEIFIKV